MSDQGYILIVDDEQMWRQVLSDTLTGAGFRVDTAATIEEAKTLIETKLYHLFVFDIRLENNDPENVEGMELLESLARQGLGGAVEIIILSAYGTRQQMRKAFRNYVVADFVDKELFDNLKFLDRVKEIFAKRVRVNLGLDMLWQEVTGPIEVVHNIEVPEGPGARNGRLREQVATELNELLRRLFYQADSLLARPLTPGYSGAGILSVQPEYDNGQGQEFIVKFGDYQKISQESENFDEYVQPFLGGTYTTNIITRRRTPRLGGIVYSFLGAVNTKLEDFGSFYRRSAVTEIIQILDYLFKNACERWYANFRLQNCDLKADYEQTLSLPAKKIDLEVPIKARLTSVQWGDELCFRNLAENRPFRNPIRLMPDRRQVYSTYMCITHGDLNEHNIMIDQTGRTWLIDFQRTRRAYILRDVVKLEAVIRIELLASMEATLAERLTMEEALPGIEDYSQPETQAPQFATSNPSLAKAYAVSCYLRSLAYDLISPNRNVDFNEYYLASYYQALKTASYESLSLLQREHALMSASLLAYRLGL